MSRDQERSRSYEDERRELRRERFPLLPDHYVYKHKHRRGLLYGRRDACVAVVDGNIICRLAEAKRKQGYDEESDNGLSVLPDVENALRPSDQRKDEQHKTRAYHAEVDHPHRIDAATHQIFADHGIQPP